METLKVKAKRSFRAVNLEHLVILTSWREAGSFKRPYCSIVKLHHGFKGIVYIDVTDPMTARQRSLFHKCFRQRQDRGWLTDQQTSKLAHISPPPPHRPTTSPL